MPHNRTHVQYPPDGIIEQLSEEEMTLSELIEHVGNENVEFQNLAQGSLDLNICKRDGRITFYTGIDKVQDLMRGGEEFIGLVVWLPKSKLPEYLRG